MAPDLHSVVCREEIELKTGHFWVLARQVDSGQWTVDREQRTEDCGLWTTIGGTNELGAVLKLCNFF